MAIRKKIPTQEPYNVMECDHCGGLIEYNPSEDEGGKMHFHDECRQLLREISQLPSDYVLFKDKNGEQQVAVLDGKEGTVTFKGNDVWVLNHDPFNELEKTVDFITKDGWTEGGKAGEKAIKYYPPEHVGINDKDFYMKLPVDESVVDYQIVIHETSRFLMDVYNIDREKSSEEYEMWVVVNNHLLFYNTPKMELTITNGGIRSAFGPKNEKVLGESKIGDKCILDVDRKVVIDPKTNKEIEYDLETPGPNLNIESI